MVQRVGLIGQVFLAAESPRSMLHVAALLRFDPPPKPTSRGLAELADEVRGEVAVSAPWNLRLARSTIGGRLRPRWVVDTSIDLDYHVRRSALPKPGDERELGALISRLHSRQIDLSRPPWEIHLIEGLDDDGFAMFVKVHHALVDGYTGMRLMQRSLSTAPDDLDSPILFAARAPSRREQPPRPAASPTDGPGARGGLRSTRSLVRAAARLTLAAPDSALVRPGSAPRTIFNARIGRNRRFATQQLDLEAVKSFGKRHGASVNDMTLSILGGALRTYLLELDSLPAAPLIALVPVSTRSPGDAGGGNAFGAVLASLGTNLADPVERLRAVTSSTTAAKAQLEGMGPSAAIAYATLLAAPTLAQLGIASVGATPPGPFSFNLIVSNVPGPIEDRYFRGSRLQAMYPASLQLDAAALNVTLLSYANTLNFGFSGDRDAVPHLQRLAVLLREEWMRWPQSET